MKKFKFKSIAITGAATLALTLVFASPTRATAGGTDILHLTEIAFTTNNNVEPKADGVVMISQNTQGKADNQKLSVALTGLTPTNTYELVAIYDTDTNVVDLGPFTTDSKGKAAFYFTKLGNGHGGGKKSTGLPASIDPVSLVREVDVVATNMQVVLSADLSSPDKLQYLIKRDLSTSGVKSSLFIQSNGKQTHFRLLSTGLAANSDYLLVLNDEVVQTNTSNSKGRLDIRSFTNAPANILDLQSVQLWDGASNVVLQTELP